ncbi:MAG: SH3 domain-containing protein [Spirochaetaceae bacterium]
MTKHIKLILLLLVGSFLTMNLLAQEETNLRYTTLDGGLPLKSSPSMMSKTIDLIPAGDIVQIISIKKQAETIDSLNGYWSQVDWDSTIGWVFDPFLSFDPVEPEENGLYLLNNFPSAWTVLTLINEQLVILSSRYVETSNIQIDKTEPLYPDLRFNLGQETEMFTIKEVLRYGLNSYGFTIYNMSTGQKYEAHFKLLNQKFSAEWTNLRGQGMKVITVNSEHTQEYDQYEEDYDDEYEDEY